tara:strand:+ start:1436 stop:1645 length:210 start_codon:yes stop_codon:yes gene_type:complete
LKFGGAGFKSGILSPKLGFSYVVDNKHFVLFESSKSLLSILEKFRALQILGETILKNDYHNVNIINYFT